MGLRVPVAPQLIRPDQHFVLVWDTSTEPPKSPNEQRWWKEALAEVDAICTALSDA